MQLRGAVDLLGGAENDRHGGQRGRHPGRTDQQQRFAADLVDQGAMAINVVAMLTIEVITVIRKDWLSSKPTACQSTLE